MRIAGLLLVLIALGLFVGCPRPINTAGDVPADGQADGEITSDAGADPGIDVTMHQTGSEPEPGDDLEPELPGAEPVTDDDQVEPATEDPAVESAPGEMVIDEPVEPVVPDVAPEEPAADPAPVSGTDGPIAGRNGDEIPTPFGVVPGAEPVEEPEPQDPQAALDAGRMLGDGIDDDAPKPYEEPPARVSRDSVAFAGYWTVAVVNQDSKASLTPGGDDWSFDLSDDGKCAITQSVAGDEWSQRGGWEVVGDELTLRLGPGGQRSYTVVLNDEDADIAILTDEATDAVLFCLRIDPEARSPKPAKRYDSDFGIVKLYKSGMAYWAGSYGEPEGSLNFRMLGDYMVGTWEQQPGSGFILLKLDGDEFSGWWWYEASTEFDGTWRGSAN